MEHSLSDNEETGIGTNAAVSNLAVRNTSNSVAQNTPNLAANNGDNGVNRFIAEDSGDEFLSPENEKNVELIKKYKPKLYRHIIKARNCRSTSPVWGEGMLLNYCF